MLTISLVLYDVYETDDQNFEIWTGRGQKPSAVGGVRPNLGSKRTTIGPVPKPVAIDLGLPDDLFASALVAKEST